MRRYCEWGFIFGLLLVAFWMLLRYLFSMEKFVRFLRKTGENLDEQERRRLLEKRKQLAYFEGGKGLWSILERELDYSGLKLRFSSLTAGRFFLINVAGISMLGVITISLMGIKVGATICAATLMMEYAYVQLRKARNLGIVNEELVKFLDFLGNYSLTAGELTSILSSISRYLQEPLQSALVACEMESRVSGDVSMAILSMAEKIEHPQFKQLSRNLEITCRYGADFSSLVEESRRSLRDYQRQTQERKGLIQEAAINMGLLLMMSILMLTMVNFLIGASVWEILFSTVVGYIALGIIVVVLVLFGNQVINMNK